MTIVGVYAAAIAVLAASALVGGALWTWTGARRGGSLAPAVGFATVLIVAGLSVRLPGGPPTAAGMTTAVTLLAAIALGRRRREIDLGGTLRAGLPVAAIVLVAVALPFVVTGRAGLLGVGNDNDSVAHLLAAWWLGHPQGLAPGLLRHGYPFAPHALVAAVSALTGVSLRDSLTGLIVAIPVLTAWTALAALDSGRRPARWAAAALVGLPYLAAAYFAQGAYKEITQALLVLAFALAVERLARDRAGAPDVRRAVVPLALLVAASVYTYSYLGAIWMVATLACWLVLSVLRSRPRAPLRTARAQLNAAAPALRAGALALFVICAFEIPDMVRFAGSGYNHAPAHNTGNLIAPIPAAEGLGVWLSPDFRFPQPATPLTTALVVLALVAAVAAVAWWVRRRDLAVPAALIAALLIYWQATLLKNPYNAAKGLVIVAPLIALVVGRATLAAWAARPRRGDRLAAGFAERLAGARWALAGTLGAVVLIAGAYSSFLALRDAPVGPQAHARQLDRVRAIVGRQPTLFLVNDDFADFELRGVPVGRPRLLYPTTTIPQRPARNWQPGQPFDFDSFAAAQLDRFRYAVTSRTPYASAPPPNWHLAAQTRSYEVWRRDGPTPTGRIPLTQGQSPGRVLDCATPQGARVAAGRGHAWVTPRPVAGPPSAWRGTARLAGERASQVLRVPAGTWDISLQYVSREGFDITAPGLRATLPPSLDRLGAYWYAGTIHFDRPTTVRIGARTRPVTALGRLLGASGDSYALNSPPGRPLGTYGPIDRPLGRLALTRHGAAGHLVPLDRACGSYVDWYRLGT